MAAEESSLGQNHGEEGSAWDRGNETLFPSCPVIGFEKSECIGHLLMPSLGVGLRDTGRGAKGQRVNLRGKWRIYSIEFHVT